MKGSGVVGVSCLGGILSYLLASESFLLTWSLGGMGFSSLRLSLWLDYFSSIYGVVVLLVMSQVYAYSFTYMASDFSQKKFFLPLSLFSASMILFIFAGDLVTVFLAWDGLGVSSFLLVGHYSKEKSSGASILTLITNRLGDSCFVLGIASLFCWGAGGSLSGLGEGVPFFLFVIAAWTKSAQFPFSAWLPAAMAAPTPVSALVHSSTLVTAGVYLIMRLDFSFYFFSELKTLSFFASLTFAMACLAGVYSYDLKRAIAMSTMSHLSLMFMAVASGSVSACLFHLCTHAVSKALAFLCAGNLILSSAHSQDLRKMGGALTSNPLSSLFLVLSLLSLAGAPFLSCFYSKEMIFSNLLYSSWSGSNQNGLLFCLVGSSLSAFSSWYVLSMLVLLSKKSLAGSFSKVEKSSPLLTPLVYLGGVAVCMGGVLSWWLEEGLFSGLSFSDSIMVGSLMVACWPRSDWEEWEMGDNYFNELFFLSSAHSDFLKIHLGLSEHLYSGVELGWVEALGPQFLKKGVAVMLQR